MPHLEALNPILDATFALINLVTASLLLVAFRRSRMRAVLCLASGYLFTSLIVVARMLSFPGVFSGGGLPGAEPQTNTWLEMFQHAGLPLFAICYTLLRRYERASPRSRTGADVVRAASGTVAGACLLTLFASVSGQLFVPTLGSSHSTTIMFVNLLSTPERNCIGRPK
jgi:hypothetical protein